MTRDGKPVLAVLPWEFYEPVMETLAILGDTEHMAALRSGIGDLKRGGTADWAEVKVRLDIAAARQE